MGEPDQPQSPPAAPRVYRYTHLTRFMPVDERPMAYLSKKRTCIVERFFHRPDFLNSGIVEIFERVGWRGALKYSGSRVFENAVITWMSSLSILLSPVHPNTPELHGIVDGDECVLTLDDIRQHYEVDVPVPGRVYEHVELVDRVAALTNGGTFEEHVALVFGTTVQAVRSMDSYNRANLCPLAKILFRIILTNVLPRLGDQSKVTKPDIVVLSHLMRPTSYLSYGHIVFRNIVNAYDSSKISGIPHAWLISSFLERNNVASGPVRVMATSRLELRHVTNVFIDHDDDGFYIGDNGQDARSYVHQFINVDDYPDPTVGSPQNQPPAQDNRARRERNRPRRTRPQNEGASSSHSRPDPFSMSTLWAAMEEKFDEMNQNFGNQFTELQWNMEEFRRESHEDHQYTHQVQHTNMAMNLAHEQGRWYDARRQVEPDLERPHFPAPLNYLVPPYGAPVGSTQEEGAFRFNPEYRHTDTGYMSNIVDDFFGFPDPNAGQYYPPPQ